MPASHLLPNRRWKSSLLVGLLAWTALLASGSSALAAEFFVVSSGATVSVGDVVTLDFLLFGDGSDGPGQLDIQLNWGFGSDSTPWTGVGALSIFEAPSIIEPPAIAGAFSPGCAVSFGSSGPPTGDCGLSVSWDALPLGLTTIASMSFAYEWRTGPGWEICEDQLDPGCVEASQAAFLDIQSAAISGDEALGSPIRFLISTLGEPYIRPIPEPGSALLIGLGLAALASPRRSASRRFARHPDASKCRSHFGERGPRANSCAVE